MIQLYAKIHDLIPTESTSVNPVPRESLADDEEYNHWHYTDWLDDIRKNGIKHQLNIHPDGHIGDGNFRYWNARDLFLGNQIDNYKWAFLPINLYYFMGMQCTGQILTIRGSFFDDLTRSRQPGLLYSKPTLYTKRPVIPSLNTIWNGDKTKLGTGSHPFCRVTGLEFLKFQRMSSTLPQGIQL